jgi:2-polyprenyl-3-methyl-5-hydroxy-6-metoxy-1,4-benzoquinol methylase
MREELKRQKLYWDKEVNNFDSIYIKKNNKFKQFIDDFFRWDMYARFDYTFKHSEPIENKTILDVGCGTGRFSLEYARRNAKKVVGIDISSEMLEICKQRVVRENLTSKCEFIKSDLLDYKIENTFDICIGIGLFDYIKNSQVVVKKMQGAVSDRVIMSFPKLWTWRAFVRKIRLKLRGCDVYYYSRKKLENMLKTAGFKSYEIEAVGQLFCVTAYVN